MVTWVRILQICITHFISKLHFLALNHMESASEDKTQKPPVNSATEDAKPLVTSY